MKFKQNQIVYTLIVNITSNYASFKIEIGRFLGKVNDFKNVTDKKMYAVEYYDEDVNYLNLKDIFKTEKEAIKALTTYLQEAYKNRK